MTEAISYKLDVFEGPLDLLLHLIARNKLNIYDISISELLDQYLAKIHEMQEQMEVASSFLEMAARLVYIKTVSLLPKSPEAEQLKQELTGQLLEYQECKRIAQVLAAQISFDRFVRTPMEIESDQTYTRTHALTELMKAYLVSAGRAGRRLPPPAGSFHALVARPVVSVSTGAFRVLRMLRRRPVNIDDVFATASGHSELVAIFLAMLELIRSERVTMDDDGALTLRPGHHAAAADEEGGQADENS